MLYPMRVHIPGVPKLQTAKVEFMFDSDFPGGEVNVVLDAQRKIENRLQTIQAALTIGNWRLKAQGVPTYEFPAILVGLTKQWQEKRKPKLLLCLKICGDFTRLSPGR